MDILANVLSDVATNVAETSNSACPGLIFEEPVCPEEIL